MFIFQWRLEQRPGSFHSNYQSAGPPDENNEQMSGSGESSGPSPQLVTMTNTDRAVINTWDEIKVSQMNYDYNLNLIPVVKYVIIK